MPQISEKYRCRRQAADKVHPPRSGMQLRASNRGGCARTMRPHPRRPHGGRLPLAHTLTTFSYGIRRGFGRGGYRRFWGRRFAMERGRAAFSGRRRQGGVLGTFRKKGGRCARGRRFLRKRRSKAERRAKLSIIFSVFSKNCGRRRRDMVY